MNEAKPISTPLASYLKLSKKQSSKTKEENEHMKRTPYTLAVRSLMYAMAYTRLNIAHAVRVANRYMNNSGKHH